VSGTLRPDVAASVLRAAADAGVSIEAPPRGGDEFDRLWTAARIYELGGAVDDETWLARERLKAYALEYHLTGGWLGDLIFGNIISLVQPHTVLRDAPRRGRK
jgi:hypothetical protein